MKKNQPIIPILAAVLAALVVTDPVHATTNIWTGASSLFWATPGNWSPSGPPGAGDDARFFDAGATNDLVSINNIVTNNTTIRSLWLGQTNGFHNMLIHPGVTLTIAGTNDNGFGPLGSGPEGSVLDPNVRSTVYVGTKVYVTSSTLVSNSISGEGTLVLNNPNNELNVRQTHSGGTGQRAALDLFGLNTFVANLGRIRVGDGESEPIRRAHGFLFLARTNTITLTGTNSAENVQLVVGNNDVNNNGNGGTSFFVLGERNTINVDHILVGGRKTPGNMSFNVNAVSPSLRLRGSDGTSRVTALRIGDQSNQAASGNPTTGTVNLGAGTVDITADRVIVGTSQSSAGSAGTGNLTLGAGTLDANTIELAYQVAANNANAVTGNLNISNTTVTVNSLLRMGRSGGGAGARNANLNIDGGSVTVNGSYINEGNVTINVLNGSLNLPPGSQIAANTITVDGGVISNAVAVRATNSLTFSNGGVIAGNPAFDMGTSGLASWLPGTSLTISNSLSGAGTFSADLILAPGATLNPGATGVPGSLSVLAALALNGGTLALDLSADGTLLGVVNDYLSATGNLNLTGVNNVMLRSLSGLLDTVNNYTLISYSGSLSGNAANFQVVGPLASSRYTFAFDTTTAPNAVLLNVGGSGPSSLTWVGDGVANTWNAQGAANWNDGVAASQFFSLDAVTFNDSGSALPSVNLVGSLIPGAVTVNNPTKNYAFAGAGGLSGGSLTKNGAGSLTFSNVGDLQFSGAVTISNGAVTFANTGLNTFGSGLTINGGSVTWSGGSTNNIIAPVVGNGVTISSGTSLTVANTAANSFGDSQIQLDGTLTFNQSVDANLDGSLGGAGTLIKNGSGALTLNNNSGLATLVQINAGTIIAGNGSALGSVGASIASGARLNINAQNLSVSPVTVIGAGPDGAGAIVNNASFQANALASVTLTGNTTFGGSGQWNTDPVLNAGLWTITSALSTSGQAYNLTKTGVNQVTLLNCTIDPALADIDVQQGLLSFQGTTDGMGNPTNTLTVRAGATLSFFGTATLWDKRFVLFGNGVTPNLLNYNGDNTLAGPVTLNGNCVMSAVPPDRGAPVSLTLSGPVGGSGSLSKTAQDTLILAGVNNYSGATTISQGTLLIGGINQGTALTTVSGGTLGGTGLISGPVTIQAGGTLSPGDATTALAALRINNTLSLSGANVMDLDKTGGVLTSDLVTNITALTLGGTLQLNLTGEPLAAGDSVRLFSFGSANGAFASILPAEPGPGLAWNTSTLATDGRLRVGSPAVQIGSISVAGANVVLTGSGGTPNADYYVLTSTNVALPLSVWTILVTNQFDGSGNFNSAIPSAANATQQYFLLQVP